MKKTLALLLMAFVVFACSKSDPENPALGQKQESITLGAESSENIVLSSSADQATISFTASTSWTASILNLNDQSSSWCSVLPASGQEGTGVITIKATENTTYESRTASVSIKAGNASKTIKVEQVQKDAIVLAANSYEVSQQGGALDFDVLANTTFEVVIPDSCASWITRVESRALSTTRLYFDIAPHTGKGSRKGAIVIKGSGISQIISVEQYGEVDVSSIPDDEMWYMTSDATVMAFVSNDFGRNIISNTYKNGIGKVKFDGPVTKIATSYSFSGREKVTALYMPDCVESFSISRYTGLKEVRVPKNMKEPDTNPFYGCTSLEKFIGSNISDDGHCIIINNKLYAFAGNGLTEYNVPDGVTELMYLSFSSHKDLQQVNLPATVKILGGNVFDGCTGLKTFTFPENLEEAHAYAFQGCTGLTAFYGNSKFRTEDNKCFINKHTEFYNGADRNSYILNFFAGGAGETSYTIPEGIGAVNNYAFNSKTLTSVTFPNTIYKVGSSAFINATNLEAIYGHCASSDNKAFVSDSVFVSLIIKKGTKNYNIPNDVTKIDYGAFQHNAEIESITMGDQVTQIGGYAFAHCPNLKSVTLSANLTHIGFGIYPGVNPFFGSTALESIYIRSQLPPTASNMHMNGVDAFNLADYPKLKMYVPKAMVELYKRDFVWKEFAPRIEGYEYSNLPTIDFYVSSDFTADRKPVTLQSATEGNGINIVLLGDGYSDRQIADGTYKADMEKMYGYLFNIEPMKSFKHLFNVKYVNVVSLFDGYGYGSTGLGGYKVQGSMAVSGNDDACFSYAKEAFSDTKMDNTLVIVVMNTTEFDGGTCYMYDPESEDSGFGAGAAVAYFTKARDDYNGTEASLLHEAIGHGFAKLNDEYYFEGQTIHPQTLAIDTKKQNEYGWYRNVCYSNDKPATTVWSKFLSDSRYANDMLGIYEGGATSQYGVWRPTEFSMMHNNIKWFNAPSREAIYIRIHTLAYGSSWTYDYEKFVEYDTKNIGTYPGLTRAASVKSSSPASEQTGNHVRPVITGKTWRQAGK